jgi:hypothetical protein
MPSLQEKQGTIWQPFAPAQNALRAYAKHFTRVRKIVGLFFES